MTGDMTGGRVLQLNRDREFAESVGRALADDPELERLARSPHLEALRHATIGEFLEAVRAASPVPQRHLTPLPAAHPGHEMRTSLSDRELEVVRLIVEGLSNKEISARLALSDKTVKNHISHILAKLKLTARTQVAVMALRAGIF
jgi:two-component system, NarL family, response regulator DevR